MIAPSGSKLWGVLVVIGLCLTACTNSAGQLIPLMIDGLNDSSVYPTCLVFGQDGRPSFALLTASPPNTVMFSSLDRPPEPIGIVGDAQRTEMSLSLALKPDDEPGVAYVDDRTGDLVYAERLAGRWITVTVDAAGQVGYFPSLAYDREGNPHISYFDNTNNDIKYATRHAGRWRIETIDATGLPGFHIPSGFTRLALTEEAGADGRIVTRPHVAYLGYRYKPYDGALRYATRYDDGWRIETVDRTRGAGGFPSLVIDAGGTPWISYYRAGTWDYHAGEARLAHRAGSRWKVEVLDTSGNAGRYNAVALTSDGQPAVAYYAARKGDLRLAWTAAGRWWRATLADAGDVGAWVNLQIDRDDRLHVTYADASAGLTRYGVYQFPDAEGGDRP